MRTLVLSLFFIPVIALADLPSDLRGSYKSALLMDADTRAILYAENAHNKLAPASLVKMMLLLIAMEKLESGEIGHGDEYQVTAAASKIGGHQVYLKQGEVFVLEELLKAVIMASANDAAYAIAEHIAGSQSAFVKLMNQRAVELGLKNTRFTNVHGLPPDRRRGQSEGQSTAYDLAVLGQALTAHPFVLKWSSTRLDSFRQGTFQLLNTNHRFLRSVEGADGLKTGYHPRGAGFCAVVTATRAGRRLIAVVMGAENGRTRLKVSRHLIESGFNGQP
jgi:D-alanyl-D-alanine carboxypeptidase (penicillin-binding protein 5/6)